MAVMGRGTVEVKSPQDVKLAKAGIALAIALAVCGVVPIIAITLGISVRLFYWAAGM